MKKRELVECLKRFHDEIRDKFDADVCEGWMLEGFLDDIRADIFDIENEIESEEED